VSAAGIAPSVDAGYPVPLAFGPSFVLEPQAQLNWQRVNLYDSNDGLCFVDLGSPSGPLASPQSSIPA
jgi:hypothetical protein